MLSLDIHAPRLIQTNGFRLFVVQEICDMFLHHLTWVFVRRHRRIQTGLCPNKNTSMKLTTQSKAKGEFHTRLPGWLADKNGRYPNNDTAMDETTKLEAMLRITLT
eukprot:scaffold353047_cov18-Prasinocladus_malaysianus.AAC.1